MFELDDPAPDGLVTPDVGAWSADKHYYLRRYIDGFTTAMRKKWNELHYIDLFAGAGIEQLEGGKLDWGSSLIAAQAPHRFTHLHLVELDRKKFVALQARLAKHTQPRPPQLICGDANKVADQIVGKIPSTKCLSLAFLDPYGLHLHYETVRRLATRAVDLIIFFPDHLDALRNWEAYYAERLDSNLDRFLGTGEWRERKNATSSDQWVEVLRKLYENQLKKLGYSEFDYKRIARPDGVPLYRLIFCSRDKAGGKIWRGISSRSPDGQGHLW